MAQDDNAELPLKASFTGTGGVVVISGKTYAVGLIWEPVQPPVSKARAQAKAAAAANGADLFCLRKPKATQYALGSRSAGHQSKLAPLAALLADRIDATSFVAAFVVEGGYYLCAVRDDQILPGCERLFNDAEEARDAFCELFYGSQWSSAIAPKDWPIEGTVNNSIEEYVTGASAKTILAPVSNRGTAVLGLIALAVLAAAGGGYWQYTVAEEERLTEEARQVELARIEAERNRAPAVINIPAYAWEGRNLGVPVLASCVDAILRAPISHPGWAPVSLACNDSQPPPGAHSGRQQPAGPPTITMSLRRDGGTITWLSQSLESSLGFRPSVTNRGAEAIVSWPLRGPALSKLDASSPTGGVLEAMEYLARHFDERFIPIELRGENAAPFVYQGPDGKRAEAVLTRSLAFSFRTGHDPKEFARILAPLKAMTVKSVRLEVASWTWSIEGNAHECIPTVGLPAKHCGVEPPGARPAQ